jgi:hypothetical protein
VEQATLFVNVGQPVADEYIRVGSWLDAVALCSRLEYENYLLDLRNDLSATLVRVDRKRSHASWNKVVLEVRPRTRAKVADAVDSVHIPADCVKPVATVAGWCLLNYCMECEYRDLVQIDHFHRIWQVFKAGHFPCGVQRRSGKQVLMVF